MKTKEEPLTQPAAWPLRLPIIRHIRALIATYRVNRHYEIWRSVGAIETNDFDRRCIDQIRRGIV